MKPRLLILGSALFVLIVYLALTKASLTLDEKNKAEQEQIAPTANKVTVKEFVTMAKAGQLTKGVIYYVTADSSTVQLEAHPSGKSPYKTFVSEGKLLPEDARILRDANFQESLTAKKKPPLPGNPFSVALWLMQVALFFSFVAFCAFVLSRTVQRLTAASGNKPAITPKERFCDVAGCNQAIEEVKEVVDYLKHPQKFGSAGGRMPGGLILYGPPGTGKTLLAKAIAGEAGVPFYAKTGADFIEVFVGVGPARVRKTFKEARKNAPCIIFIDEADAIGSRGAGESGGDKEERRTIDALLSEMDGFQGREGVVIVAATNDLSRLDPALLRPGRLDRKIAVDLPDAAGRLSILNVHKTKFKITDSLNMEKVAKFTTGFSGADLKNLLNEAALAAGKEERAITFADIDQSRDKVLWGRERALTVMPHERRITCVHEAGHALIQALAADTNIEVHKITIIPRGSSMGSTLLTKRHESYNQSKKQLLNAIRLFCAGRAAEAEIIGEISSGAHGDIVEANKIARAMVYAYGMGSHGFYTSAKGEPTDDLEKDISQILSQAMDDARRTIRDNRRAVEAIAEALDKKETLLASEIYAIIQEHPGQQAASPCLESIS